MKFKSGIHVDVFLAAKRARELPIRKSVELWLATPTEQKVQVGQVRQRINEVKKAKRKHAFVEDSNIAPDGKPWTTPFKPFVMPKPQGEQ